MAAVVLLSADFWLASRVAAQAPAPASAPAAVPAFRQANHVAVLTVHGVIDHMTRISLERRMKEAVAAGADAVVLDIDTPGGEMGATLDICNLLRDRRETPANVVAWIDPRAYSAGTIIALACREIVVAPGATFGDAAPIQINPFTGLQPASPTERAKMLAPILTEILDSARRNHYDEGLVQAFVRLSDGLWMLENPSTGERAFVGLEEYRAIFGDDPPPSVAGQPIGGASTQPTRGAVRPSLGTIPRPTDAAGLAAEQARQQEAFTASLPAARPALTAADRPHWRLVRQVIDDQSLLTLRSNEALYYGLASAVISNDSDLLSHFGAASITRYDQSWSESMVRFLVSLPVRGVLIIIFLVCLFIEIAAPGIGVFGTVAAVALLVLIGAPTLAGMAQWWEVVLIVAGLALVLAELFLIPGTGLAGMAGVVSLLVGLVATFVSGDLSSEQGQAQMWTGLVTTLLAIFIAGVGMWLISRQIYSFPVVNRLILHEELPAATTAGQAEQSTSLLEAMGGATPPRVRINDVGSAVTDLRPAGRANLGGRLLDVQSTGAYIPRGAAVRVIAVQGIVIEVEEDQA